MDKYYLQINFINKNNKKIIKNYQLYNNDKLIKEFDDNNAKKISKIIKEYKKNFKLEIDKSESNYKIYDINFLKKYIGIPSKKISNLQKYKKEIIFVSTVVLGIIGLSILDHKVNPDLYNNSNIESSNDIDDNDDIDFIFIEDEPLTEEPTTESSIDNIDTFVTYYPEEKEDDFKVVIYSDNDDNIQENLLPTEMVALGDNVYTRCIGCEDLSNDNLLSFIKQTYKVPILLSSKKYGIDQNWIAAKIRRENPKSTIRTRDNVPCCDGAGIGLMQIEGSVWNNNGLEDIDGSYINFDCKRINDIAENHKNMDKVARFIETKNINSFDDLYNLEITDEEQIEFNITKDDLEKYKNATYGIERATQVWENNNNIIITNNNNNVYNYKLTYEECLDLGNIAYNKGITCVNNCLFSTYNFEDTITETYNYPGDSDYQRNIDCYLNEGEILTNITRDGTIIQTKISHKDPNIIKAY